MLSMRNKGIKSILLVDDDQDDKYFFATALEEVDPEVRLVTAANGLEALEKLRDFQPDLILLDLVMPRMNGLGFLKALRRQKLQARSPIIVYTADLSVFDEKDLIRLGASQVTLKPVDFDATVDKIRDILQTEVYLKTA
jgi:CheY-like chemotaxis protein